MKCSIGMPISVNVPVTHKNVKQIFTGANRCVCVCAWACLKILLSIKMEILPYKRNVRVEQYGINTNVFVDLVTIKVYALILNISIPRHANVPVFQFVVSLTKSLIAIIAHVDRSMAYAHNNGRLLHMLISVEIVDL